MASVGHCVALYRQHPDQSLVGTGVSPRAIGADRERRCTTLIEALPATATSAELCGPRTDPSTQVERQAEPFPVRVCSQIGIFAVGLEPVTCDTNANPATFRPQPGCQHPHQRRRSGAWAGNPPAGKLCDRPESARGHLRKGNIVPSSAAHNLARPLQDRLTVIVVIEAEMHVSRHIRSLSRTLATYSMRVSLGNLGSMATALATYSAHTFLGNLGAPDGPNPVAVVLPLS